MPDHRLPVRPDLDQLRHQARDLLREWRRAHPDARAELTARHPSGTGLTAPKLSDAQLVIARRYQASSWPRLVQACELATAIWADDLETVRRLIEANPHLIHEPVLIRSDSNWGPPLSYAANLGRDRLIDYCLAQGARDLQSAMGRAALQGQVATARRLHALLGSPRPPEDALGGPAYTLSEGGTAMLLELGARVYGDHGERLAPIDVVLETDSRKPSAKHAILALYERRGFVYPDTAPMAVHRGRVDLLEACLAREPELLTRRFTHEEFFPPELGCHDEVLATHGTPLKGTTLLHLAIDFDEYEIAAWLIARGVDVNARAAVDVDGFGGHTSLFATVVSQPAFWMNHGGGGAPDSRFARLLLEHGADPNVRASLRKQLHPGYGDEVMHEYRDVTARSWGERFHRSVFVNGAALQLVIDAGGVP